MLLARLMREALGSPHLDSRVAGTLPLELHRALAEPALQAKVSDLEFAHAVLVLECDPIADAPILDLRLRKGVRRHGMKLVRAAASDCSTSRLRATTSCARLGPKRGRRGGRGALGRAPCGGTGWRTSGPARCSTWPRRSA